MSVSGVLQTGGDQPITEARNSRVRASRGALKMRSGSPCSTMRPLVEEADAVGNFPGEAHLVGDEKHGEVVLLREARG